MIKVHEDRTYGGAIVASLSVPWGQSRDDPGGYHLVWTRDAVEAALALVAVGKADDAARVLAYLIGTQAADGSWAQNYYPSGEGYWTGSQLDEVALPTLLAAKLKAAGHLVIARPVEDMIHRAIAYIVRNGPMTDQDRWEENPGASPFTLSIIIAALAASAPFFDPGERDYILALADCWNERIEGWTYVVDGDYCRSHGVPGYYVRLGPRATDGGLRGIVDVRNRADGRTEADQLVGLEFLYLVRTGLRRADDPRIVATVELVDSLLKVETPSGPSYHRYNGDGYGEHADGTGFNGTGIGRLWPLLTGERGHYALAASQDAQPYLDAMARMTGPGGLIPEQIWDSDPIPERGLAPGKPSGSAMPLVWAHAEYLKLLRSATDGVVFDRVEPVYQRYAAAETRTVDRPPVEFCSLHRLIHELPAGSTLRIIDEAAFDVVWSADGWKTAQTVTSRPLGSAGYTVDLETAAFQAGGGLSWTFHWTGSDRWLGYNMDVRVMAE